MIWATVPLILLLGFAGAMAAFLAFRFWRERKTITGWAFLIIAMACIVVWEGGTAITLLSARPAAVSAGHLSVLLATALLPVALFRFSLSYAGKSPRLPEPAVWCLLLLVPAITRSILIASGTDLPVQATIGNTLPEIAFWIGTIYALLLTLIGLAIVIQSYHSATGIFHGQLTCLLIAALVPLFLHCSFLFRLGRFGIVDFAPFTFIVSIAALGVGMWRYRLFNLVPVEHGDVLRQVDTGIVVLDPLYRIISINPAARRLLAIRSGDVTGRPIAPFLEKNGTSDQPPSAGGAQKNLVRKEIEGSPRSIEIQCTPLVSSRGVARGSVMVLTDVTDRILVEQSLDAARRNINLLTSITRHDILNQLTVIILHNEILRASFADESLMRSVLEQEKAAKTIRRQIEFTKDYEKLGENIPAWISVEKIILRRRRQVEGSPIRFLAHAEGLEIFADSLIDRVFENLVDNSLRYGQKVTEIRISTVQHLDGLTVVYEDNGIGIPACDKARIFQRGSGHNIGFGLFFSREILSVTGITIRETGTEGKGARFEIIVPWGRFRFRKDIGRSETTPPDQS
ncbi:MAG TPA: histidine kinase N-terminal 7TM domain-containing protein [Methanoregulaceae archaeon]|nr:histidine kinase N-terminal 7TM domain-containing protein [Methanoregulaceae archaeon]HPD76308.1 histidine kinase N-terminal 7TM domain-containing protein [Methanoregulaceae archaeon]HRY76166.1 histidine kinase N-terminal 7TM domain-containing protein [Methanoregulaceae archaeon]